MALKHSRSRSNLRSASSVRTRTAPMMATMPKPAAATVNSGLGVLIGKPYHVCDAPSQRIPITNRTICRAVIGNAMGARGPAVLMARALRRNQASAAA